MTTRIRKGEGSLGKLLNDRRWPIADHDHPEPRGVDRPAQPRRRHAGKLITDDALYERLDAMTAAARHADHEPECGRRHGGQLLRDKQLYENMNQTVGETARARGGDPQGSEEVPERQGQHLLRAGDDTTMQGSPMAHATTGRTVMLAFLVGAGGTGRPAALLFAPATRRRNARVSRTEGARSRRARSRRSSRAARS